MERFLIDRQRQKCLLFLFQNLFIEQIIPMLTLTEQQMKKYLDTPQRGK